MNRRPIGALALLLFGSAAVPGAAQEPARWGASLEFHTFSSIAV
jgi:hypothetical protein